MTTTDPHHRDSPLQRSARTLSGEPRFREIQPMWWNTVLLAILPISTLTACVIVGAAAVAAPPRDQQIMVLIIAGIIALDIGILLMRMRTVLTDDRLTVAIIPLFRRRIPVANIRSAKSLKYNPMSEAGGWGIKRSRKHNATVFSIAGDQAVLLRFHDHDRGLLVGTFQPDEFVRALRDAGVPDESDAAAPAAT